MTMRLSMIFLIVFMLFPRGIDQSFLSQRDPSSLTQMIKSCGDGLRKLVGTKALFENEVTSDYQQYLWSLDNFEKQKQLEKELITKLQEAKKIYPLDPKKGQYHPGSVSHVYKMRLIKGVEGIFKPKDGGNIIDYHFEIAAYRLDRFLGINMVPVTTRIVINNGSVEGSFQVFVTGTISGRDILKVDNMLEEQFTIMRIFDYLIKNKDRHPGNYLYLKEQNRVVLIDHERAFIGSGRFPVLMENHQEEFWRFFQTTRGKTLLERLKVLDKERARSFLGEHLTEEYVTELMERKEVLIELATSTHPPQ